MDEQGSKPAIQTHQVLTSVKDDNLNFIKENGTKAEIITELRNQLCLAGPLLVVSFLQFSFQMISLMFVGHLGQLPLAGASLATSFAGLTGFSLMLGMGGALETFCGQAYGAEQYHLLGVYMQRAMLVYTLLNIPVSVVWGFTGQIFAILKQDPQISAEAGLYSRWLIPSIFPYGILQCQLKFLQTQNNTIPLMISARFTVLLNTLVCWALVFQLGLGSKGAALSNAISYWTNVLIFGMYINFSSACEKTWKGFSKDGMKKLLTFLKLGVPSALMVWLVCFYQLGILVMRDYGARVRLSSKPKAGDINDVNQVSSTFHGRSYPFLTNISIPKDDWTCAFNSAVLTQLLWFSESLCNMWGIVVK